MLRTQNHLLIKLSVHQLSSSVFYPYHNSRLPVFFQMHLTDGENAQLIHVDKCF